MGDRSKARWSLALNVVIAVMTTFAWFQMALGWAGRGAALSAMGIYSLRYFTVLSNLFSGFTSLAVVVWTLRHRGERLPDGLHLLRYVATTSVALTLVTVEVYLAPAFGFGSMHAGANLWFHLLLPLFAIVGLCAFEADRPLTLRASLVAVVPMIVYGAGYLANILINGIGEWPNTNDWYGFTAWGLERAPIVFVIMALVTWLIALALRAINQRVYRSSL